MDWSNFAGKKVGLLGAGKENISLIPHLKKAGADITLCDKSEDILVDKTINKNTGPDYLVGIDNFDYVFRSPGLPLAEVKARLSNQDKLTSATDLLLSLKGRQVVAITGTKGKGTSSTMIFEILKAAQRKVILAGNIGNSIFDEWDKIEDETVIVMELSSFQLEDVSHSAHRAVVLPISPDHLQPLSQRSPNYHADLPSYIKAKENITAFQGPDDYIIFSIDSQPSRQIGQSSLAKKISVSFGRGADFEVVDGTLHFAGEELDIAGQTKIKGNHMFHNAAIACAVASTFDITVKDMIAGLENFKPLPHRMESVGIFDGVEYVDDSYATAPDATIAALSAYEGKPLILILGGSSKGADFSNLAKALVTSKIKSVVLIGQEAKVIEKSLIENAPDVKRLIGFTRFRDAVETAVHQASPGDVVLLSPACASKDMFANAADRGEQFTRIIHELL